MPHALFSWQEDALTFLYNDDGPTRIKCCGMFRPQDIDAVNEALPDMVGFVVNVPRSHRSLTPRQVKDLAQRVDDDIFEVGVFVDEPPATISALADAGAISIAQLHGHEDADYIAELRKLTRIGIIQAFQVHGAADVEAAQESVAEMVLLDAGQGSGERFDWSLLRGFGRPYILAGGLTPANVADAIARLHPWGVDLSSGLETDKLKDPAQIQAAVAAVKGA